MANDGNEQLFRRLIEEGFNRGDLAVVEELVAPHAVEHQSHGPDIPTTGPESVKAVITTLRRSFSDLALTIEAISSDGDTVWARLRSAGTNDGPFFGNPPTGKRMAIDVIDVVRFENGRMVEHWGVADRLGVLLQLGLAPRPAAVPAS
jgi:predicted ester cyclase